MDDDKAESVYRKIKADWDHQAANPVYEPAKEGGLRVEKPRSMARALLRSYGTGKFIFGGGGEVGLAGWSCILPCILNSNIKSITQPSHSTY